MKNCVFVILYSLSWAALLRIIQAVLPSCVTCAFNCAGYCLLGSIIAYYCYPIFKRSYFDEYVKPHNKAVFITGCDTGFGHELTKRLDAKGFVVFASCLFPDGEGAKKLKESCSDRLHVLGIDVSKDDSVAEAAKFVKKNLGNSELWALVNNAGVLKGFDIAFTKTDVFMDVLNVNTLGHVRTTKAFFPLLVKSTGRIVNITSLASRTCLPHMAAYSMSKYAARAFSETLRQEMHPWGIKVIEIEPEGFQTLLSDPDALSSKFDDEVREIPEEIKQFYEDHYFRHFKKAFSDVRILWSSRIFKVPDALEDAVCLEEPCRVYRPTRNAIVNALAFVTANTPASFIDFSICVYKWARRYPKPSSSEF